MKASKAQSIIIKQQKQMLNLLIQISAMVGLNSDDVSSILDIRETVAPNRKPKRTKQEVAEDEAEKETPESEDSDSEEEVPQIETSSETPNKLPYITNY